MIAQRLVDLARSEHPPLWFRMLSTPLAKLYAAALRLDSGRSRNAWHPPGKVISIGNLAAGGTGKTPVVIALTRYLVARGARVAILTRGYGSGMPSDAWMILRAGVQLSASKPGFSASDEGMLCSQSVPAALVGIGVDRVATAGQIMAMLPPDAQPTHWILDDGFQHKRIARDVDLVLLDATRPFGSGRLLPAGDQREPPQALKRASGIIFTRADASTPTLAVEKGVARLSSAPRVRAPFLTLPPRLADQAASKLAFDMARHAPVWLVSGIANPKALLASARAHGIEVGAELRLPDHASISPAALASPPQNCRAILTTEKDWWRQPTVFAGQKLPVFVLPLALDVSDADWSLLLGDAANCIA